MRGAGGLALILALWAAPGAAQDRPPEMSPVAADEATRPPQTPAPATDMPVDAGSPAPDGGGDSVPQSGTSALQPSSVEAPAPEVADGTRPPERPPEGAEPLADGGDAPASPAAGDAAGNDAVPDDPGGDPGGDATESPDAAAASAQPFGPPPPPAWFTLAGDPARDAACRLALAQMGADFRPQAAVTDPDNRDCGIARPLQVLRVLPDVALEGEPLLRCETALSLALWTRDFVQPAAATLPDGPRLTALRTGPGYSCRDRVGTGAADPKPSEHGYGNAVDVMGFVFDAAEPTLVQPRQGDGDPLESFQRAVQGTACLFFATVLGPGSNAAHDDHLHLDIAARNGGWRLCE